MAVARPDWVLMDLARAFTPSVLSDRLNVTNNMANKGPAGTVSHWFQCVCLSVEIGVCQNGAHTHNTP